MKTMMLTLGNFFFRYRNQVFPAVIVALFCLAAPPLELWGSPTAALFKDVVAVLVVFSGLALRMVVVGYAYIKRGGLNKRVYAKDLVTEGMFGVCRNPLYVGNMLVYSGIFLLHGDPLVIAIGICLFTFMYQCIVHAEEAFLEDKFGDAYRAYCRDVPRWTLRLGNFERATEGMTFNVKRVIAKDYSTVSSALIAVLGTEMYRFASADDLEHQLSYLLFLAALMALVGLATALISHLKKRGVFREPKTSF
ncbi:isoprenylcysteine carboxylmethyltransferase family protein [Ensifer sp.]|uniref:methyltransferase family protein n=1 Tax=Ensifer sp. TaxID=1872086 RepID=UPI0028981773|nr:isoprenylcysteine carboxylmethyltransferase family protein [Ensifer sp.]